MTVKPPVMEKESVLSDTETTTLSKGKRSSGSGLVHIQVLKIREEDSHLGEDIIELLNGAAGVGFVETLLLKRRVADVMLLSRPILPCSPLRGKTDGNNNNNNKTIKSVILHTDPGTKIY